MSHPLTDSYLRRDLRPWSNQIRPKRVVSLMVLVGFLLSCDARQPDEYQFGEVLDTSSLESLSLLAQQGLVDLAQDQFKVHKVAATDGFNMSMLDAFLYEKRFSVVHVEVEIEFLRDLKVPSPDQVRTAVGKPGWRMDGISRELTLAGLFRKGGLHGEISFRSGDRWQGDATALFARMTKGHRLVHVGQYRAFKGISGGMP